MSPGAGIAVSPQDMMSWDPPSKGGTYGFNTNLDYVQWNYQRVYTFQRAANTGDIQVTVVNSSGAPISSASVSLNLSVPVGTTDANGMLVIPSLAAGVSWEVSASIQLDPNSLPLTGDRLVSVTANQTNPVTITLCTPSEINSNTCPVECQADSECTFGQTCSGSTGHVGKCRTPPRFLHVVANTSYQQIGLNAQNFMGYLQNDNQPLQAPDFSQTGPLFGVEFKDTQFSLTNPTTTYTTAMAFTCDPSANTTTPWETTCAQDTSGNPQSGSQFAIQVSCSNDPNQAQVIDVTATFKLQRNCGAPAQDQCDSSGNCSQMDGGFCGDPTGLTCSPFGPSRSRTSKRTATFTVGPNAAVTQDPGVCWTADESVPHDACDRNHAQATGPAPSGMGFINVAFQ